MPDTNDDSRRGLPPAPDGSPCCSDPFSELPAELRPRPAAKLNDLRRVTCPHCGLVYWTNRESTTCIGCAKSPASG